ncbi:MAG: hypothetical protein K9K37_08620 [Desulfocapsa sp.]|nr:hypothetical protein [Desulfocapsa sp.]
MTKYLSGLFFSLSLLLQLPGLASASCTIPGTERSCEELVSELPWPFIIHVKETKPIRITYLNSQEKQQSNLYLKMFLEISDHENRDAAAEDFSRIHQKADPDMGLSYGWDLVTIRDKQIYHLHADCTLSEPYFNSMVESLERIIGPSNKYHYQALLCRCGGGCKLSK